MSNNNTFSLTRFGKYLSSDLKAAMAGYGISFCILVAMPVIQEILNNTFRFIFTAEWGGQPYAVRMAMFCIVIIAVMISFPAKCYGGITERKAGTSFTMVPVSTLEKTLSMLLICCIILPAAFCLCYGAMDFLVCALDPTCGKWIFNLADLKATAIEFLQDNETQGFSSAMSAMLNPLLYVDDLIQIVLIFLLGAIWFKRGKVAKTFLTLIILSMAVSMITSPFFVNISKEMMESGETTILLSKLGWIFNNLALVDTISDTVVNVGLCVAIYFRIKTIKH